MKVSIVTAVWNRERTIRDTMESVLAQDYADLEYVVVDGQSTDGTVDVIRSFERPFNGRLKWVSEPDGGIYDAMNKGLRMAGGDIVAILNSDDFYHRKDTVSRVVTAFREDPELQAVYGDNLWVSAEDPTRVIRYANGDNWNGFTARCGVMPPHATFFVRKENFERFGYYDTSYRICADYERELNFLLKRKLKSRYLGFDFMTMRKGGVSSSGIRSCWASLVECRRACLANGLFTCWPMQFVKLLVKFPQMLRRHR